MPVQLSQPPFRTKPIDEIGPKKDFFSAFWERWLLQVWSILVNTPKPASASFSGTFAGGGASKDVSFDITLIEDTTVVVLVNIIQSYVTAVPDWQLKIQIDAGVVVDTGIHSGLWQTTSTVTYSVLLAKGVHTIHGIWVAATNATLIRLDVICIPEVL